MLIYARSGATISSIFDEIDRFIGSHITSKKVEHEKLFDVVLKHWDELERLAKEIQITCINETTVLMKGLLSKVLEAKEKLTALINQYTDEERRSHQLSYIAQNVKWYYTDLTNGEIPYSAELNGTIELAHMDRKAVVEIMESDGQKYDVDFSQMISINQNNGQTRKLSRMLIGSQTGLYTSSKGK